VYPPPNVANPVKKPEASFSGPETAFYRPEIVPTSPETTHFTITDAIYHESRLPEFPSFQTNFNLEFGEKISR
jgi:hypothetical protein